MFTVDAGLLAVEAITGPPPEQTDSTPKKSKASVLQLAAAFGATAVKGGDVPYGW